MYCALPHQITAVMYYVLSKLNVTVTKERKE